MKPLACYLEESAMSVDQLVAATRLEAKVVRAIVANSYTPSPSERQRIATALGLKIEDIAWGHAIEVEHFWGHGPQFGRTP